MKQILLWLFFTCHIVAFATNCPSATLIPVAPTLPYTQSLTCGAGNDINAGNAVACGSTLYYGGQEALYAWTPTNSYTNVTIAYNGVSWSGIFIFAGCPTSGGTCINNITGSGTTKTLNVGTINAGTTYYIMFDTWPTPNSPCPGTFTINGTPDFAPPAPTQDPAIPTCATGAQLNVAGTPPANVQWYWQSTASGTSMANLVSGPYTVFLNGTYFVRAYNSVSMTWSLNSSSVTVSNIPTATNPPSAVAALDPSCAPTGTTLSITAPPGGVEYYWQGTDAMGTSTALSASLPYSVTQTGTYYVAAYETATQCWSSTVGTLVTVSTVIPVQPIDLGPFYYCQSSATMPVEAGLPPSGSCALNATASGTDNTNVTATINDFSCATGNITSATLNATIGGNCTVWYYYSIIVNGVTVATQQCNQTGFDLTPYLPLTSVSVVSFDNPADGIGDFVNMNLTVNLTYVGATSLSWYDAASSGNLLGSGNSIETIGTSVMPVAANGVYSYFVQSNLGGCSSAPIEAIVNVNSVNVTLDPVAVSCNNGMDGTFAINSVLCGSAPFSFSVDGGSFGPAPTDLAVGEHIVIVMDGTSNQSSEYTIEILDAVAPNTANVDFINNDEATISWAAGAFETQWNIEWGLAGFTPGTGAEVGSDVALTNSYDISGLDGNTDYDFYISANCGGSTTPGDWTMTSATTLCDPIIAQGWCEDFSSTSPSEACWKVINNNGDIDAWDMNSTLVPAFSGDQCAQIYTDFNGPNNDDYLVTPLMTLTNNEIMSFNYRVYSAFEPNTFEVLLSPTGSTDPADFTEVLMAAADYSNTNWLDTTINLSAYSGDVAIAFHVPNGSADGWYLFIDQVCIDICIPTPSIDGTMDVCRLDNSVDLNTAITAGEPNGVWIFEDNQSVINGSIMNISTLANSTFDISYIVTTACTADTAIASITVHNPSTAGDNGVLTTCMNQPINLLGGLGGTADLGGVWTGPTGIVIPNGYFTTGQLPGQFNYTYVTSNGVCPNDTSEVLVNVQPCDWLSIDELAFEGITVYPNPSTGVFYISNEENGQDFTFEVLDLNGKVLVDTKSVIGSSKTELDLTSVQDGVYMIRLTSETGQKMIRIVKN